MAREEAAQFSKPPPAFRIRPSPTPTRYLFVGNAGPRVGDTADAVAAAFAFIGGCTGTGTTTTTSCSSTPARDVGGDGRVDARVVRVEVADSDRAQCLVTMRDEAAAVEARQALHGEHCAMLGGRKLWVQFSQAPRYLEVLPPCGGGENDRRVVEGENARTAARSGTGGGARQEDLWCPAVRNSAALGVPGATLVTDFITREEEEEMLESTAADSRWQRLAKRRVIHYGYAFDYGTRDARAETAPLPTYAEKLLSRAAALGVEGAERATACDQLTVNEYSAVRARSHSVPTFFSLSHLKRVWRLLVMTQTRLDSKPVSRRRVFEVKRNARCWISLTRTLPRSRREGLC